MARAACFALLFLAKGVSAVAENTIATGATVTAGAVSNVDLEIAADFANPSFEFFHLDAPEVPMAVTGAEDYNSTTTFHFGLLCSRPCALRASADGGQSTLYTFDFASAGIVDFPGTEFSPLNVPSVGQTNRIQMQLVDAFGNPESAAFVTLSADLAYASSPTGLLSASLSDEGSAFRSALVSCFPQAKAPTK
jgi:hypothetical protein